MKRFFFFGTVRVGYVWCKNVIDDDDDDDDDDDSGL